jgi:hypothetical protein
MEFCMIEKLFQKIEEAHLGLCMVVEYYHVINYVVSIYDTPANIEDNKPIIRVQHAYLNDAASIAYNLFTEYLKKKQKKAV